MLRVRICFLTLALVVAGFGVGSVGASSASGDGEQSGEAKTVARLLIIGDSVFDALDHVASAKQLITDQQKTIFAVQGCQKLIEPGCYRWVKLSALDHLKKNAGKFSDAVVIGTGYNDRIGTPFRQAVIAITDEASRQGVEVIWITYREVRHVRGNSITRNKQLAKLANKIPHLHLADWNAFSEGKEKAGWFRGDRLHLLNPGANGLAQIINQSVTAVFAKRELVPVEN